ncbi:T9SS type A sorting domain-containing protein [Kaistella sp. DKR-2]|uniref:T9SS type A sorting domain-containing protein n=1 Tax=Kaistella soli TaxID=2849654 RepID=UPI001C27549A|nr:T9SS type A sorting domain-containing protein [Kaistella soli]MBU8882731.1 T9SS type A sorting domain-containing protein [Kaistella soli]
MIKSIFTHCILFFGCLFMLTGSPLNAQQTVFTENFNAPGTPQNSNFTATGSIGTSNWTVARSGGDLGAKIDAGMLTLSNDISTAANVNGWVAASTSTSNYNPLYKPVLSQNTGVVSWSFNMRQIRANPSGFTSGKFGAAFILAGTPGTTNSAGKGYAIVLGQGTTTDPIRLATYSNGLSSIVPKLSSKTPGLSDFGAEYSSIRVEYNPADNKWSLFLRKDNTASFLDPKSGTLVFQDEAVITDYVNESLAMAGAFWNAGTAKIQTSFFDNFSVTVQTPELTALQPDSKIANSGAFTLTVDGKGFLPTSKVYWNGALRTTTYVSSVRLTAAIPATDIAAPATVPITVANGTFFSNALDFMIEPSGEPALTLSATTLGAVSTVTGTASSATNTYTISGINLVGAATVTAPTNFEVSLNGNVYANTLTLPNTGGGLTGQPITLRARLTAAASPGNYSGNIVHSTSGAVTKQVAVTGRVLATEPTSDPSGINFSNITSTGFSLGWTNGNGAQRVVLIKEVSAVNSMPADGITYNASAAFGAGSQIGTGNFVVYKGNGNSVQISGLTPAKVYYVSIIEFNGASGVENYRSSGLTGSTTTLNSPVGLQVKATNTSYKINFDDTADGVNLDTFQGFGMSKIVESGQLDSNAWAFSGFSSGAIPFGGNSIEDSSYENGPSDGGEEDTGIYAFNVGTAAAANYTLGIQPGGTDFNPGTVTLQIQNQTGAPMTSLNIGYKVYVYNDQPSSSQIRFSSSSTATGTYTDQAIVDVISPAAADMAPGWKAYYRVVTIPTGTIANNAYYYVRWSGSLASGSGAQDEFAIDDIEVIAYPATNPTPALVAFDGVAEDFVLQGNAALSADLSVQSRLLFNGGKLAVKDKTLTLVGDVVNTTVNGLTGGAAAKLVVRGTRNPALSFDQTSPGTTNIFDSFNVSGSNVNTVTVSNNFSVNNILRVDELKTLNLGTTALSGTLNSIQNNGLILTQNTTATPFPANKTWNGTGILNLNAAGAQTLVAGTYTNLKLSSAAGTTATGDLTVNGILDLPAANASATKGSLDMGLFTLTMGGDGTNTGVGEVTGIIKRNSFVNNKLYTFGHPNSSIIFPVGGTLPTTMSAKLTMGIAPAWRPTAIKRYYDITQSGAAGTKAIIRQHYLDSELNAGNVENKLVFFGHKVAGSLTFEQGKSSNNSTDNYVEISNANIAQYFTGTPGEVFISLDNTADPAMVTWNGSVNTSWTTIENWTPNLKPTSVTKVIVPVVPSGNYPTLNPSEEIASISIEAGATVNSAPDSQLILNLGAGAWQNNGTFNPGTGTSKIIFTNADATVAGNTTFNNVEIVPGASLRALEGNYMGIAGSLVNKGTMFTTLIPNTIEFKGTGQTIPAPGGAAFGGYHHLIVSGTGAVIAPTITTLNIRGDLTLNQPVSFAGKTINLAGVSQQAIGGTAAIVFDNLTVNKDTEDVVLAQDITVGGTLTLSSGNIIIGSKNLTLGANPVAGSFDTHHMIVADGAGLVKRPFAATGSYLFPVGELTGAASYSPVTVNVTSGTFSGAFVGVNVIHSKHPNNNTIRNYLRKYWNVQQTGITGAVATITAQYETVDVVGAEPETAAAQLNGVFNVSTNPWVKFGALSGNTLVATNAVLTAGQISAFTGLRAGEISIEVHGYGEFCSGSAHTMNAVISGGDAPYSYEWSNGLANAAAVSVPTATAGTTNYTLTVRDANGFSATDSDIPVVILPASVGGTIDVKTQQICSGNLAADLHLNGSVGKILHWQKSLTADFATSENLPNFTTTLTGAEMGLLTQTTYFRAVLQNGSCEESVSDTATVVIRSTVWDGSGWSAGAPDALTSAIFTGNYTTTAATDITACTCEVRSGAVLTIGADSHITVQNSIVNQGSIIVESDGSLIQINDDSINSGAVLVKRDLSFRNNDRKEYNYLISPVENSNLKTDLYRKADGTPVIAPFVLYHNEANSKFYNSSGAYIPGRALAVKEPAYSSGALATAFFTGKPVNGKTAYNLAYSGALLGYNLVGNPYPSNIDLNLLYADNSAAIESTFRFWDNTVNEIYEQQGTAYQGNAYAIYNAAAGAAGTGIPAPGLGQGAAGSSKIPNKITKVGQGFMVKSLGANKVLNYSNHIRLADNTGAFFYGKERKDDRYWLQMTAPSGITSTLAVVYFDGGNKLFGTEDSKILDNSDVIYSKAGEEKVSINGSSNFVNTDVVALGMKGFAAGQYRISLREREGVFANGQSIYLKDKYTGAITNLSEGGYVFNAGAGESTGRFEILYQPEAVLAADHSVREELAVYRDGRDFVVKAKNANITDLELYDMAGRLIYKILPNSKKAIINAELLSNGAYLLKIHQNGHVTARKIIK